MDDKQILVNLVASLSLADHMGDALGDCEQALKLAGIDVPKDIGENGEYWSHLATWLAKEHGAVTVWGTSLLDDEP